MAGDFQYTIYLSFNNQAEGFVIPVNPESIEIKEGGQGKTYDIVGKGGGTDETRAGEINVIKNPHLKEISFSSIFPSQWYPFVTSEHLFQPMYYINLIRKWQESRHPIRFVYAGHYTESALEQKIINLADINIPASIESFEWKEVGGSPGDIEYTLKLKEYVFYSARSVKVGTDSNGNTVLIQEPPKRPDERIRPLTYRLKKGDTLLRISKRFLGTDARWREIKELNGFTDADLKNFDAFAEKVIKIPQN